MAPRQVTSHAEIGRRIAKGREDAALTQAELARALGVDRTSVAKIESGSRKVSATELVAIAAALDRPIDWFMFESPAAVLSRRQDPSVGGLSPVMDARVERLGRDVAYLLEQSILRPTPWPTFEVPTDFETAERLAREARTLLGVPHGPVYDLQRACEQVGLLAFSLDLGAGGGDAAYIEVDGLGVALVNGCVEPGRRRFDLAHELAHHLVGDAYAPDSGVLADGGTERYLNAVAIHLLLLRPAVKQLWDEIAPQDRRLAAVAIAARFRTSWTATCSHLRNLALIDATERTALAGAPPKKGDFLEVGERWVPELEPPSVPPDYGKRVVGAYRAGKLTASRTSELLWGTVPEDELPEMAEIPLDGLRRELEPLP